MKRFLKTAGKWALILGALYIGSLFISGLDFETRIGWFIFGLAMAIGYVDGSQKDRMAALEYRVKELEYRLDGKPRFPFD